MDDYSGRCSLRFEYVQNQSSSVLTSLSIELKMNGFRRYCVVTCELFHAKTAYFRQLNALKRIPFHLRHCFWCLGPHKIQQVLVGSRVCAIVYNFKHFLCNGEGVGLNMYE